VNAIMHLIGRILSPQDRAVRLLTRNGKDWTRRFPTIVDAAAELKARARD
jgi:ATP-dependent DNA ligase